MRAGIVFATALAAFVWTSATGATHAPPGTKLWAYQANVPPTARIYQYDIGTDTYEADCRPTPSGNGRAIAFDPQDSNLWYAFIGPPDGFIHKTTPPPAVPKALFDPGGNDTLAVTHDITGVPNGTYLLTDAGEFSTLDLLQVADAASAAPYSGPASVPPCTIVTAFDPPVGVTGIDLLDPPLNDLIATDQDLVYDFGNAPYLLPEAVMPAFAGTGLEDISVGVPGEVAAEPFMLVLASPRP